MKKPNETKPKYRRVIGRFASVKTGRAIEFHSHLMRDLLYLLECDPTVVNYREACTTVFYCLDDKYAAFRCDFEVDYGLFEEHIVINKGYSEKVLAAVRQAYSRRDVEFSVVDEALIRRQPNLENAKLLYRYARQHLYSLEHLAVYQFFQFRTIASLGDFQAFLKGKNLHTEIAYTLLFKNHVWFDANQPLTNESEIRLVNSPSTTEVNAK